MRPDWCDPADKAEGHLGVFIREDGWLVLDILSMTPGHKYAVVKWGEDYFVGLENLPNHRHVLKWTRRGGKPS